MFCRGNPYYPFTICSSYNFEYPCSHDFRYPSTNLFS
jgi:hypothetical protein